MENKKIWYYTCQYLKHVPGTKIGNAYGLSKRPDLKGEVDNNNDNQILIKEEWICSLAEIVIKGPEVEVLEKIKIARSKDEEVVRVVEKMKRMGVKVLQGDEWQIEGDLVLKEEKMYILKNEELRIEIIWL